MRPGCNLPRQASADGMAPVAPAPVALVESGCWTCLRRTTMTGTLLLSLLRLARSSLLSLLPQAEPGRLLRRGRRRGLAPGTDPSRRCWLFLLAHSWLRCFRRVAWYLLVLIDRSYSAGWSEEEAPGIRLWSSSERRRGASAVNLCWARNHSRVVRTGTTPIN